MPRKNIGKVVTGEQFTEMSHRAQQGSRYGDDPQRAAAKLSKAWFRLDTIQGNEAADRERRILSAALAGGATVLQQTARLESDKKNRYNLNAKAMNMKLDSAQTALSLQETATEPAREVIDEVVDFYEGRDWHSSSRMEVGPTELVNALNARALDIQLRAKQAQELGGARQAASATVLQAMLGGLINESAEHLAVLGENYQASVAANKEPMAMRLRGSGGELAYFTNQLADWYQNGVLTGNPVRMALVREDQPHLTGEGGLRRGFDAVVTNPDRTITQYTQVKTSSGLGGAPYIPEITVWRPNNPDFMDMAVDAAERFSVIVDDSHNLGAVALANQRLTSIIGEPAQLN